MISNFDDTNDNEIIYFFKLGNKKPINTIMNKYNKEITIIRKKLFYKFSNSSLEYNDFNSTIYFSIIDALNKYKCDYNKSFKNYLFAIIKWNMLNLFIKYKNNLIYSDYYINKVKFYSFQNNFEKKNNFLYYIQNNMKLLTKLEKNIFLYKLDGKTNHQIMNLTNYDYKKIDNAFQRSIKKLIIKKEVDIFEKNK